MIDEHNAENIDKWLQNFQNDFHNNSQVNDIFLEELARSLCDDIPFGYEASHRIASWLFNHINIDRNRKANESHDEKSNDNGMIIIGYQGIGKSTYASKHKNAIDLESSLFKVNDKRDDNWYIIYCKVAIALAKKGYIVLTSSHKEVIEEFAICSKYDKGYVITIIAPDNSLEQEWIEKLKHRWYTTKTHKDLVAYQDANTNFKEEIDWLFSKNKFTKVAISEMTYNLDTVIDGLCIINKFSRL